MKFIHVYNEKYFDGLVKNDMLNKDSGFKIQHNFSMPNEAKFNEIAKKGGKLYNFLKEGKYAFYVDRIAGGTTWHNYDFDKELIKEYKEMLGDWFLGFQLHESGSNRRRAEWPRLISKMGGNKGPYDKEELMEKTLLKKGTPDGQRLYGFSQDSVEYYATKKYAETYHEFFDEMAELFTRRMNDTDGNILPCDSYFLATKIQRDMGMNTFMPEVGCQIPLMRLAVALARGVANVYDKTWGAYYECWREIPGIGYCMPCFNSDPSNEWYLPQDQHGDDFTSYGENGGSSRLLQNRIYYHALMSGADYFAEEWGLNCSYSDMETFELSHYGQVKKDFIKNAEKLRGIKANIPFAIVMPNTYSCIELPDIFTAWKLGDYKDNYMSSPLTEEEIKYFGHIEDVLKLAFARGEEIYGNEGHVLTNSRFGDLFDIIYEDTPIEGLKKYKYLIDATKEGVFIKANEGKGLNILDSSDIEGLAKKIEEIAREIMPCYVDGLHYVISKDENGQNYLTIFNNEGNERDLDYGDIIHNQADKTVKVEFKKDVDLEVCYQAVKDAVVEKVDGKTYNVTVPAAGFVIFKF